MTNELVPIKNMHISSILITRTCVSEYDTVNVYF